MKDLFFWARVTPVVSSYLLSSPHGHVSPSPFFCSWKGCPPFYTPSVYTGTIHNIPIIYHLCLHVYLYAMHVCLCHVCMCHVCVCVSRHVSVNLSVCSYSLLTFNRSRIKFK